MTLRLIPILFILAAIIFGAARFVWLSAHPPVWLDIVFIACCAGAVASVLLMFINAMRRVPRDHQARLNRKHRGRSGTP